MIISLLDTASRMATLDKCFSPSSSVSSSASFISVLVSMLSPLSAIPSPDLVDVEQMEKSPTKSSVKNGTKWSLVGKKVTLGMKRCDKQSKNQGKVNKFIIVHTQGIRFLCKEMNDLTHYMVMMKKV